MKVIIFFLLAGFIISYVADKGNFKEKIQPKKNERIIDEFR